MYIHLLRLEKYDPALGTKIFRWRTGRLAGTPMAKDLRPINRAAGTTLPLPCACANLRQACRVVTQIYDQELRESGLRATQFALLQAFSLAKGIWQRELGELLGIDSTTPHPNAGRLRRK